MLNQPTPNSVHYLQLLAALVTLKCTFPSVNMSWFQLCYCYDFSLLIYW